MKAMIATTTMTGYWVFVFDSLETKDGCLDWTVGLFRPHCRRPRRHFQECFFRSD